MQFMENEAELLVERPDSETLKPGEWVVEVHGRTGLAGYRVRVPECGKDFCDTCGDCVTCYGDWGCTSGAGCWLVDYID